MHRPTLIGVLLAVLATAPAAAAGFRPAWTTCVSPASHHAPTGCLLASGWRAGDARGAIVPANVARRENGVADFARPIALALRDAYFYYFRGNAYLNLKQYDRAIADYTRAIRLDPRYVDAFVGRAAAYYYIAAYNRALREWGKVIKLAPKSATAWGNRAWTYCQLGEPKKGLADARRALKLRRYGDGYAARACNNRAAGNVSAAIRDYEKALELSPGHQEAGDWRRALDRLRAK